MPQTDTKQSLIEEINKRVQDKIPVCESKLEPPTLQSEYYPCLLQKAPAYRILTEI